MPVSQLADTAISVARPKRSRMRALIPMIVDVVERLFVLLFAIPFLWAFAKVLPTRPNLVLVAISEMLAVGFILTRRRGQLAVAPVPVLVAFCGTALPLLVRPGGAPLVPALVSSSLLIGGLGLSVISKLYLNRSFGLIAANRGVKVRGPYRIVRHPMYLGYIVNQLGFLAASFSPINFAFYLFAWTFQILRVREEESVLRQDPAYRRFARRVGSRLIPGVY